mgnify:CR=1 FL=1
MKKILLGSLLFGTLFTACSSDDDYNAGIASPQASDPTVMQSFGNGSVTEVGVINLADVTAETVQVANIVAPTPTSETAKLDSMVISFTSEEGGDAVQTTIKEDGLLATDFFTSEVVEAFYGKRPVERTINASLVAYFTDGNQAFLINSGEFKVKAVPAAPHISENYYIVGGPNDWTDAPLKQIKFNHSDKDVYEDPVFTVVFDAAASGDTWFAIGDDEACEAIPDNWNLLLGIVGGDSQSTEGRLDVRANMNAENSFCVPAGAKKIKVTINMMEYSFKVEPVSISDSYYLIGGALDWAASAASKEQKFNHSNADVFEDPVFTYVFAGNGGSGDIWFAFGDDDTCEAINNGDWTKLFGYRGDFAMSGSFDRRYNLGDGVENSFHVDGTAKFYRLAINMAEMTYEISELNFGEYFYEIGNESGWSTAHALYGADGDGKYQGYYYLDGEFKFKPNEDNWDNDLEFVAGTPTEGTLTPDGGPNVGDPGAGFYRIDLDAASLSYKLTKIENVSIIGTANGNWDTDTDLTYNKEEGCWEVTTDLNAGEMKFRGNHNWDGDVDLGGSFDNLVHGGSNIAVEAGNYTIKLYISIAGQHHAVVTKN